MGQSATNQKSKKAFADVDRFVKPHGPEVTRLREDRGIEYEEELAESVGLTGDEIVDIEASEPALESYMIKLAKFFGVAARNLYSIRGRGLSVRPFADLVRHHREERGLTQAELAAAVSCNKKTIENIEHDKCTSPELLLRIAKALKVPYARLKVKKLSPSENLQHDFDFDHKEQVTPRIETANGIRYEVFRLTSLSNPQERSFRAKRYDLSVLPADDEEKIAAVLARHHQICYRLRDCPHVASHVTSLRHGKYCWVIDDWYDGPTLAEVMSTASCCDLLPSVMRDIALALAALHKQQVICRELTPHSVIVRRPQQLAVLTDFELGKILEAPTTVAPRHWKNSNPYRAPEVGLPRSEVRPCADFYSWAVILAHALSGEADCPSNVRAVLERADLPSRLKKRALQCLLPQDERPQEARLLISALKSWK